MVKVKVLRSNAKTGHQEIVEIDRPMPITVPDKFETLNIKKLKDKLKTAGVIADNKDVE